MWNVVFVMYRTISAYGPTPNCEPSQCLFKALWQERRSGWGLLNQLIPSLFSPCLCHNTSICGRCHRSKSCDDTWQIWMWLDLTCFSQRRKFSEKLTNPIWVAPTTGQRLLNALTAWPIRLYCCDHDDIMKWKHFRMAGPLWIHRPPVDSTHKGQWHGDLMFSLICARTNGWGNNRATGNLRRHRAHY